MRVRRADDLHAGAQRLAHELGGEVDAVREAVRLDRGARLEADLEQPLEVDRVRRAMVEDAPLRVADAAHRRVPGRLRHPHRHLLARLPLPGVDGGLHPVELRQHLVGEIERAVAEDVALAPPQDAEGRDELVRGGDLFALPADPVRVEAGDDADVRRVVADRDVLVAVEVARGLRHLEHGGLAVRPGRVAVEVAADLVQLDEARRLHAEPLRLAQLGRQVGAAEALEQRPLVGGCGQVVAERLHECLGPRRAHERRSDFLGARHV